MKRCIYHFPEPIVENPGIGSALRPNRMLAAFRALGYEVDEITGYSKERKKKIAAIRKRIAAGEKYDFVYSESVNGPTMMADKDNFPRHPFMDFSFFRYCKRHGIPIGLFYRDVHWKFPFYKDSVAFWKRCILLPLLRYDLRMYRKLLSILYIPSEEMGAYIPECNYRLLPPGGIMHEDSISKRCADNHTKKELHIFYVGSSTGGVYDLKTFCQAVKETENIYLTVCTPETQWRTAMQDYAAVLCDRIQVIHKASHELKPYFEKADIFSCCLTDTDYVRIAMPIKVFEATGYGIPILITDSVAAKRIVCSEKRGWAVPCNVGAFKKILQHLRDNPDEVECAKANAAFAAPLHTWEIRAKQVADDLTSVFHGADK